MNSNRKTAIIAGVLYIVATVAGVLSVVTLGSLLEGPDILVNVSANESQVIMTTLFEIIMAITVAGIAFMIYPILKKNSEVKEGLARWYVGTRITEGGIFLVAILGQLSILTLSREFVLAGAPDASYFQTLTNVLVVVSDYAWMLGYTVFCIGALMLYYLLYQSKLIPRWLSAWGFIGAPLMLVAGLLPLLINEDPNSMLSTALNIPIALQEMVFAVWLIVKGFNSSAIASESVKTQIKQV